MIKINKIDFKVREKLKGHESDSLKAIILKANSAKMRENWKKQINFSESEKNI